MSETTLNRQDALLVVDVQNDFCPGGKLPVPDGDAVVDVINRWIGRARAAGCLIVASRDWHPRAHPSFRDRGGPWPEHCVQDTHGAAFHPRLELPEDTVVVSKGVRLDKDQYSAFDDTGLAAHLHGRGVERVWVAGLAEDVCVRATVLSARQEGLRAVLIAPATRAIDEAGGRRAIDEMCAAGAAVTDDAA